MGRYGLHWISTLVSCIESGLYSLYLKKFVYRRRHHLPVFIRTKLATYKRSFARLYFVQSLETLQGFLTTKLNSVMRQEVQRGIEQIRTNLKNSKEFLSVEHSKVEIARVS